MTACTTTGIHAPDRSPVGPWPVDAGFCAVVRHFLTSCWPLFGDPDPARLLAYYEGYQAALLAAPAVDLRGPGAADWRDALLAWVDRCVTTYREQAS